MCDPDSYGEIVAKAVYKKKKKYVVYTTFEDLDQGYDRVDKDGLRNMLQVHGNEWKVCLCVTRSEEAIDFWPRLA